MPSGDFYPPGPPFQCGLTFDELVTAFTAGWAKIEADKWKRVEKYIKDEAIPYPSTLDQFECIFKLTNKENPEMPSGKKNAITKIELEVNGKKISLSFEEAKSLREILNDLMGEKEIRWLPGNHYHTSPWMYPYWSWTWCGGDGGGTITLCNTGGEVGNTAMASDGTNGGR